MSTKSAHKPTADEILSYAVAVTIKQSGCTADEAEKKLKKLGKGVVQKIHDAGRNSELHVVRNLLGLPVPGLPDEIEAYELGLDSPGISLPAGVYQFKHLRRHSSGGGAVVPVAVIVREKPAKAANDDKQKGDDES